MNHLFLEKKFQNTIKLFTYFLHKFC